MKETIIIDDKIVTHKIDKKSYDSYKNIYYIKYRNSYKFYPYQSYRIKIINDFKKVDLKKYSFYLNGIRLKNIKEVYESTKYSLNYY